MKIDYIRVASELLEVPDSDCNRRELARRYLSLYKRRRVLERGIEKANRMQREVSSLRDVRFRAPLSVAGADSLTVVQAEKLAQEGIPVAFVLDERGNHAGTPIDIVISALARKGRPCAVSDVLVMYRRYMAACPALLVKHPLKRFSSIPSFLARISEQAETLEKQLADVLVVGPQEPKFSVLVDANILRKALADHRTMKLQTAIIGFNGPYLSIDGVKYRPICGRGSGISVVKVEDLRLLIKAARRASGDEDGMVGMQFQLDHWLGWSSDSTGMAAIAAPPSAKKRHYA